MEQENKTTQGEQKDLRTAFAMPQFMNVVEALRKAQDAIENLSQRYEESDKRREALKELSNTISGHFYETLSGVIGSDFIECELNVLNEREG